MDSKSRSIPSPLITSSLPRVRSSIGSSPKSAYDEERYDQLLKEFSEMDKDKNNALTFNEILTFLTEKQGEEFDFILCQEIFARLDKDNDCIVSLEEFVQSYAEVESLIINQIKKLGKDIKKNISEVESNEVKLQKAQQTEFINSSGIMQGSFVTVLVKSAQNLYPKSSNGFSNPYVIVECGENTAQTEAINDSLNPSWEEIFSLPVNKKGLDIKLIVMSKNLLGDKFLGKVSIPLNALVDQLKHEQYFTLFGENESDKWQGRICLELQWIWSKVKYLKDIISEWEKIIEEDKETVHSLNTQLAKIKKPFSYLTELPSKNKLQTSIFKANTDKINQFQLAQELYGENTEIQGHFYYIIVIYMILSIITNYLRPDFLNVLYK